MQRDCNGLWYPACTEVCRGCKVDKMTIGYRSLLSYRYTRSLEACCCDVRRPPHSTSLRWGVLCDNVLTWELVSMRN